MLRAIENYDITKKLNSKFSRLLKSKSDRSTSIYIGYQGGSRKKKAYNSTRLRLWWTHHEYEDYLWNPFGLGNPKPQSNQAITVNLTFRQKTPTCYFAENELGEVLIVHSGRIGGSRKGVTKEGFWKYFSGASDEMMTSKGVKQVAIVAGLSSETILDEVAWFVHEVNYIKAVLTSPEGLSGIQFMPEFHGKYAYKLPESVTVQSNHGLIVGELKKKLESKGHLVGNTQKMDLVIYKPNTEKASHLFEIKTALSNQNVYGAIGQLYIYSLGLPKNCKKLFVAPHLIEKELVKALKELKIEVISFKIGNGKVKFSGLNKL